MGVTGTYIDRWDGIKDDRVGDMAIWACLMVSLSSSTHLASVSLFTGFFVWLNCGDVATSDDPSFVRPRIYICLLIARSLNGLEGELSQCGTA